MRKLKITFNAPVTLGFVFICFVVTLLGVLTGGGSTRLLYIIHRLQIHSHICDFLHMYSGMQDGVILSEMPPICYCLDRC